MKADEQNLAILTIRDLAKHIIDRINLEDVREKRFPSCDYSVVDVDKADFNEDELWYLHSKASGWYGIKHVDTGFDSYDLDIVADYYGGSCAFLTCLFDGIDKIDAENQICRIILDSMRIQEEVKENTYLIVEFL